MTDSFLYARDPYTQTYVALKLYDNGDSTYSLTRDFTADITTWPAAAKYGNNVSFAEALAYISDRMDETYDFVILTEANGTITASGSEQNIYINDSPAGVYKPINVIIDLDNMIAGDTIEIKLYYRIKTGGDLKLFDYATYTGADGGLSNSKKMIGIDLLPNKWGIKVTLKQTAGTYRNFDYEICYEE